MADRPAYPQSSTALRMSVVVPTYQRPGQLMECLDGLEAQTLQPIEVLVAVRREDQESKNALASRKGGMVKAVEIDGGFLVALNAGLRSAEGDVVAFTDDDAVPKPDWLARIHDHFLRDRQAGAVGGRDLLFDDPDPPTAVVGRVTWYGHLVGRHHHGAGPPRPVDVLKGANMAFRAAAVEDLEFDRRLLGENIQPNTEIGFCLAVQRRGWKVIYDPAVLVDHNVGVRRYDTQRGSAVLSNVFAEAHNELLGLATGLTRFRRATAVAYNLTIGTRNHPGPLLALERLIVGRDGWAAGRRMRAATAGRLQALSTIRRRGERR